jgi:hypothetical protein
VRAVPPWTDEERVRFLRTVRPPLSRKGFARYARVYPGARALVSFSRVGVSGDGREALMLVRRECGMLCAAGSLVLLRRSAGTWRVVDVDHVWVS